MRKTIILLSIVCLVALLSFSVMAATTKAQPANAGPCLKEWVFISKDGKALEQKINQVKYKNKDICVSVGAYFSGSKYGTKWKYCSATAKEGDVEAGCASKWTYVNGQGKVVGTTRNGCTTMNDQGQLGKEKAWCATKVAYADNNGYGTKWRYVGSRTKTTPAKAAAGTTTRTTTPARTR
jgi:hypothetical protein